MTPLECTLQYEKTWESGTNVVEFREKHCISKQRGFHLVRRYFGKKEELQDFLIFQSPNISMDFPLC